MREPILIENIKFFEDQRGYFYESYKENFLYDTFGINKKFVQDNHSVSKKNVIRGLHFQWDAPMDKLVRVSNGSIIDVILDIRPSSQNFGKIQKFLLSDKNFNQLWVPAGFAHGFLSLEDDTHVQYKCTELYNKNGESGINPFDEILNIEWNLEKKDIIISEKDIKSMSFEQYKTNPKFE